MKSNDINLGLYARNMQAIIKNIFLQLCFIVGGLHAGDSIIFQGWWGRGTNGPGITNIGWNAPGSGNFGMAANDNGAFSGPRDVYFDSNTGYIYVSDAGNDRVQKFSSPGVYASKWGAVGTGDNQFNDPYGVAVDSVNNVVYVSDYNGNRVIKSDTNGAMIEWYGRGSNTGAGTFSNGTFLLGSGYVGGFTGNSGAAINQPRGIALDANGDVYVCDRNNHRVLKFSSTGAFVGWWGRGNITSGWHHADSAETAAGAASGDWNFDTPIGIAVYGSNVYVTSYNQHRVVRFGTNTNTSFHGFFGRGPVVGWNPGGFNYTSSSGMNNGEFNGALKVAVDNGGNVYVSDVNNYRVQKFTWDGKFLASLGTYGRGDGQFLYPTSITVTSNEDVYISDNQNHRVMAWKCDTAPLVSVSRGGLVTNAGPVDVTLAVNETNGYWSTNGSIFYSFIDATNLSFTVTTRLYYYGQDGSNNSGTNMQLYSIGAIAASNANNGSVYTSVAAAVSNASNGHTVYVFEGVYNETVYLFNVTNLSLISYPWLTNGNRDAVVLDGTGLGYDPLQTAGSNRNGINLSNAMSNRIEGFSIRNFTNGIYFCDSNPLSLRCTANIIANNKIYSNGYYPGNSGDGIVLNNSWVHTNYFLSNSIFYNANRGIQLGSADYNVLCWNIISGNRQGISADGSPEYNMIASNGVFSNVNEGIFFNGNGRSNYVVSNSIFANADGIHYRFLFGTFILSNTIYSNRDTGIEMGNTNTNVMTNAFVIANNEIFNNTNYGIFLNANARFNRVVSNVLYGNGNGIGVYDADDSMVAYNDIYSNTSRGINVPDPSATRTTTNNYFVENRIVYNYAENIRIGGDGFDNNYFVSNFISRPTAPLAANPNNISISIGPDNNWFISNTICSNAGRPSINCWSGHAAGIWTNDASNSVSNVFIYNSIFSNSYAITIDHDNYRWFSLISNRIFYNTVAGINNSQGDYLNIFGNDICSNFGTGIYIAPGGTGALTNVVSNTIAANNIFSNGNYDIRINSENADTNFISNNFIHDTRYGIYLENGPDAIEILRNTISNSTVNGIYSAGAYDNNAGAGIRYNNFIGNLTNARLFASAWTGTNVISNYWGAIAIDSITNKFADTNAATNFYAPYRLGRVGIDQSDIEPPAAPTGLTKANNGVTNYLTWNTVPGAAGYNVWRAATVNDWTNFSAPYASVTAPSYMDASAGAGYFYYVTAFDSAAPYSNESWFSDPEAIANTPPVITNISLSPPAWIINTPYSFSAVYYDYEGDGPSNGVNLVLSNTISGVATTNAMLHASGEFTNGALFTNSVTISAASEYAYFVIAAGSNSSSIPSVSVVSNGPRVLSANVASNTNSGYFFSTIQEAVDAAQSNETIVVFAGTYSERVYITNKTGVALISWPWMTNADNTQVVLDGSGISATLSAGVTISNSSAITVRGMSARLFTNGIILWEAATNCVIEANNLYSNGYGMSAGYCGGVLIKSNSVHSNAFLSNFVWRNNGGIINSNSSRNLFYANVVASNTSLGIGSPTYQGSWRLSNAFINNTIISNGGYGITLAAYYHDTTIVSNFIASNNNRGIYCDGFRNSVIVSNVIFNNNSGGAGIFQGGADNWTNTIAFNKFISNTGFGFGLFSVRISHSYIYSNIIEGNGGYGLWITNGSNVFIQNNVINGSPYGIYINDTTNNIITRNTVSNCSITGIYFGGLGMTNVGGWVGGYLAHNNIVSNLTNFRISDTVNISNIARSNYWGAIDVTGIAAKMDQSLAKGTNFYTPYRLGLIGIDQADIEPLAPPVITNMTTNASTNIIVQWQAVGGAAGYSVYRSLTNTWTNFPAPYTNLGAVTAFNDPNVIEGVTYYYFITARDGAAPVENESWFSDSSNGQYPYTTFALFTNPAPNWGIEPGVRTFGGQVFAGTGVAVYFSTNGTDFGQAATNVLGQWWTNIDVTSLLGSTNTFYTVASNTLNGVMRTNLQTNFIAYAVASNTNNGVLYFSLNDAMSSVSNNQTVVVYAGTNRENVVISGKTNVRLIGLPWLTNADNTKAVIDGIGMSALSNKGIDITNSAGVQIEGLMVCNFTNGFYFNVSVSNCSAVWNNVFNNGNADTNDFSGGIVLASNTTVSNFMISNQIWSNRLGVVFLGGPKSTFIGNRIYWNKKHGVGYPDWNRYMNDSYFEGNAFYSNVNAGFNGWGAQQRCVFKSNAFFSNAGGVGITIPSWDNNLFMSNVFISNSGNGIEMSWGTGSNMFVYNRIEYNNEGVFISGQYGGGDNQNYLLSNDIVRNRSHGIAIRYADTNFIGYNNIMSNASRGVFIESLTNGVTVSNCIYNNVIADNTNEGIYFVYNAVVNNLIRSNIISGNMYGIRIHEGDSNVVYGNSIFSNRYDGVYISPVSNGASYNTIESNMIYGHTNGTYGRGICVLSNLAGTNTIASNVVFGNRTGLEVQSAEQLSIVCNTLSNNSMYGLFSAGTFSANQGPGPVKFNNFSGNLTNLVVNAGWFGTNVQSNYFGSINAGVISNGIAGNTNTNFYTPYRLGAIGIWQSDIDPPLMPVINGVSNNLVGRIILTWGAVAGAAGYNVYRVPQTNADAWTNISAVLAGLPGNGATAYTDVSPLPGVEYSYYVTAFDNAVPQSNESWFSDSSGSAYLNSNYYISITNPSANQWFGSNTSVTFYGIYSTNGVVRASTNGTVFYDVAGTNASGEWSNTVQIPFAGAVTNVFYVILTNGSDEVTNRITNYYDSTPPYAAVTNYTNGWVIGTNGTTVTYRGTNNEDLTSVTATVLYTNGAFFAWTNTAPVYEFTLGTTSFTNGVMQLQLVVSNSVYRTYTNTWTNYVTNVASPVAAVTNLANLAWLSNSTYVLRGYVTNGYGLLITNVSFGTNLTSLAVITNGAGIWATNLNFAGYNPTNNFYVVAFNELGIAVTNVQTNYVDYTPPNATVTNYTNNAVIITNAATVTYRGTNYENATAVTGLAFYTNGAFLGWTNTAPLFEFTLNTAWFTNGPVAFALYATNTLGLVLTNVWTNYITNIAPPVAAVTNLANLAWISNSTYVLRGYATNAYGLLITNVSFGTNLTSLAVITNGVGNWNTNLNCAGYNPTNNFYVVAINEFGLAATNVQTNYVDYTPPAAMVTNYTNAAIVITNAAAVTYRGTNYENITAVTGLAFYTNGAFLGWTNTTPLFEFTLNTASFTNGPVALALYATNTLGLVSTNLWTNIITNIAPPVAAVTNLANLAWLSNSTYILRGYATNAYGLLITNVSFGTNLTSLAAVTNGAGDWMTNLNFAGYNPTNIFYVVAYNQFGLAATNVQTNYVDFTPPVANVSNYVNGAVVGTNGTNVTYRGTNYENATAVTGMAFYTNGAFFAWTNTSPLFEFAVNTAMFTNGPLALALYTTNTLGLVQTNLWTNFVTNVAPPAVAITNLADTAWITASSYTLRGYSSNAYGLSITSVSFGTNLLTLAQITNSAGDWFTNLNVSGYSPTNNFYIVAMNSVGIATTNVQTNYVDFTPPVANVTNYVNGAVIGTNGTNITYRGTNYENATAVTGLALYTNGAFCAWTNTSPLFEFAMNTTMFTNGPLALTLLASNTLGFVATNNWTNYVTNVAAPVIAVTNLANMAWITNATFALRGYATNAYLLSITSVSFGTNLSSLSVVTNTSGAWMTNINVAGYNLSNNFYLVAVNEIGIATTNVQTNLVDASAPVVAFTNITSNQSVSGTNYFWGTIAEPQSGVLSVAVLITNTAGFSTNIAGVVSNAAFYAVWETLSGVSNGTYFIYASAVNGAGIATNTDPIMFSVSNQQTTADVTRSYALNNPYDGTGDIVFRLLPANTTVSIYTISGKPVKKLTMADGDVSGALTWGVCDEQGRTVAPGVYICHINNSSGKKIVKLIIKRRKL